LLFATISGAHLYGFPSPDSDFDLRGAHMLPLEKVVGLDVKDETVQDSRIIEGLEMDIVSHDVKKFFGLLLKKNGYVLEQLFSPLLVHTTPEHEELKAICNPKHHAARPAVGSSPSPPRSGGGARRENSPQPVARNEPRNPVRPETSDPLAPIGGEGWGEGALRVQREDHCTGVITKHHAHHYFGFAETQWKLFLKETPRRVKPLLYVYRVLLTGIHLMCTGEIEANLVTLNKEFRLLYIDDLVARKLAGPENRSVGQLLDTELAFHEAEYQRLRAELQSAHEKSSLPELPSDETRAALNDLLVRIRLKS
jgi:predicted nucleotidyltransferase